MCAVGEKEPLYQLRSFTLHYAVTTQSLSSKVAWVHARNQDAIMQETKDSGTQISGATEAA